MEKFQRSVVRTLLTLVLYTLSPNLHATIHPLIQKVMSEQLTPLEQCQMHALDELGLAFDQKMASQTAPMYQNLGNICNYTTLKRLQNYHDSIIHIDTRQFENFRMMLPDLIYGKGAWCSYKIRLREAAHKMSAKLFRNVARNNYQFGTCSPNYIDAPVESWLKGIGFIMAHTLPSLAMDSFYHQHCISECAAGLQVAQLAMIAELFGDEFDLNFARDEVTFGTWEQVKQSYNPTQGASFATRPLECLQNNDGQCLTQTSINALIGISGYIGNQLSEALLDSPTDRGENFLIVEIGPNAAKEISLHGLRSFDQINKSAFNLLQKFIGKRLTKNSSANHRITKELFNSNSRFKSELDKLLDNPIYKEVKVYVHPLGLMTFGDHIRRLLKVNPRTFYHFKLYDSNIDSSIFFRYVDSKIQSCLYQKFGSPRIMPGTLVIDRRGRMGQVLHLLGGYKAEINFNGTAEIASISDLSLAY